MMFSDKAYGDDTDDTEDLDGMNAPSIQPTTPESPSDSKPKTDRRYNNGD